MNRRTASNSECSHPQYPEYREQFGEDPARFLYHFDDPEPRIRGIDDPELLRAYLTVEAERDEPRQDVIAACNARLNTVTPDTTDDGRQPAVRADGGERQ